MIEDSVHRVLDAQDLKIIKKNHFVLDSLRKVVPLQGSRVFGNIEDLDFIVPSLFQSLFYSVKVNINCFLMNLCWTLGLYKTAENLMIEGYDLIGDSILPARGSIIAKFFADRINVKKIQKLKEKQVNYYEQSLNLSVPIKLNLKDKDKKHLRGYPLILPIDQADRIIKYIRQNNLLVRAELASSNWSKSMRIIYLPLGLHVTQKCQINIIRLVKNKFRL